MDDFLGTSIQYSEKQLKLLENEHEKKVEQTVKELLESGFLDSDYDGSSGEWSEATDSDIIDNELNNDYSIQKSSKTLIEPTNLFIISVIMEFTIFAQQTAIKCVVVMNFY
eukprot:427671_1